jgi:hypothetical protein
MVYVHDRELAAGVLGRAVPLAVDGTDSDLSQRLSVIEASLRVQHEIGEASGKPLPALATAIRALRALNGAANECKHGPPGPLLGIGGESSTLDSRPGASARSKKKVPACTTSSLAATCSTLGSTSPSSALATVAQST